VSEAHFHTAMYPPARAILAAVAALVSAAGSQAQTIDTSASWDGSSYIAPFGEGIDGEGGDTATYGQTFVSPGAGTSLTSFTFWLDSVGGSGPTRFAGYVMEFGSAGVVGPVLFESAEVSLAISDPTSPYVPSFSEVTFNVPSLALDPARTYVAFISALQFFDEIDDTANAGYLFDDAYAGGGFWFSNALTWSDLVNNDWENYIGGGTRDLAFHATFTTIPEPSTYALGAVLALCALVSVRILGRRRG